MGGMERTGQDKIAEARKDGGRGGEFRAFRSSVPPRSGGCGVGITEPLKEMRALTEGSVRSVSFSAFSGSRPVGRNDL
jgi:hypothetical protein